MNKKLNTVLYMLIGTAVNLLLMLILFIVGILFLNYAAQFIPEDSILPAVLMITLFIFAIGGSFFIYNKLVKWASDKWNLEDRMAPLFGKSKDRRRM